MALAVAVIFVFSSPILATGGGGGGHCNNDCGAEIKVVVYYDANENGRYNRNVDVLSDGIPVNIYNKTWGTMGSQLTARDDGIWGVPNDQDQGWTTFRGLKPGTYIVCSYVGHELFVTEPTPWHSDPSPRIKIVERQSVNTDESRYCYEVRLRNKCAKEKVYFGFYADVE